MERLLSFTSDISLLQDLDSVLDKILTEARRFPGAEAGSIYLARNGRLRISYVHNQALFGEKPWDIHPYLDKEVDIDPGSLAGYVAVTGKTLVLDDVYELAADSPFHFNQSFDQTTGYRTKSMIVTPLANNQGKIVGVLQVINARDAGGRTVPFSHADVTAVNFFAAHAALAIERALMTRELVLRPIRMVQLRDPRETGLHTERVGAYSAEIYRRWALAAKVPKEEMERTREMIRIAAMLHDVGKAAVPDSILKKPGPLSGEEMAVMRRHTILGALIFAETASDLDRMAGEIALHHHERFDGGGYPGWYRQGEGEEPPTLGPGKKGAEIPISARIVSLADVYDALTEKRSYKEAWPEDRVWQTIVSETGRAFDPSVVQAFIQAEPAIRALRKRYARQ